MPEARGLLAVWMDIAPDQEDELNSWYRQEHLPERIAIPGFQTALRYVSEKGSPRFMAMYDLDDLSVLSSDAYMQIRRSATDWTRRIGRMLQANLRHEYELVHSVGNAPAAPAPYIYLVRGDAEPEKDYVAWEADQLLPALAGVPGVLRARLFRATVGSPKYLGYFELGEAGIVDSDAWRQAQAAAGAGEMRQRARDVAVNLGRFLEQAKK